MITETMDRARDVLKYPRKVRSRAGKGDIVSSTVASIPMKRWLKCHHELTDMTTLTRSQVRSKCVTLRTMHVEPLDHHAASLAKEEMSVPRWSLHASCGTVALTCRCHNFAKDFFAY